MRSWAAPATCPAVVTGAWDPAAPPIYLSFAPQGQRFERAQVVVAEKLTGNEDIPVRVAALGLCLTVSHCEYVDEYQRLAIGAGSHCEYVDEYQGLAIGTGSHWEYDDEVWRAAV